MKCAQRITARIEGACGALSHILLDYYNGILHIGLCSSFRKP